MPSLPTQKPVKFFKKNGTSLELIQIFPDLVRYAPKEIIIAISYPPHQCLLRDSEKSDSKIGGDCRRCIWKGGRGSRPSRADSKFLIETIAHRDRYVSPDVDGLVGDDFLSQSKREQWIDNGPLSLSSSVLVAPLIQQVKAQISVPIELKASTDAGRYLCEFIYYDSLLRFHGRDNLNKNPTEVTREAAETDITDHQPGNPLQLPVLFVHVPPSLDLMDLELGGLVLHTIVQEIITLHFSEPLQVIL
ncbi:hypothetical protein H4Q26_014745 [Puccinia striiformis f. sp. tritici PST-130]|nr:hypothetical protein H4Q26_014745 [Puccinia striiformis f. sp. tritici PST-130]